MYSLALNIFVGQSEHIIGPGSHVEYATGTKNRNFVEDHPRNIPIGPVVSEKKLEM
jgi:hypothetical protein